MGVMADIAPPHERGKYVSIVLAGFVKSTSKSCIISFLANIFSRPNAGLSIGPILGGVLSEKLGWRWNFGFLSILSGVVWITFLVAFPETCRNIVENGSKSPRGINASLLALLSQNKSSDTAKAPKPKLHHIPNPLPCLLIVLHKDTALILAVNAIFYVNYICLQASLSPLLTQVYSLSGTDVGLCYLSYGIACALATYGTGHASLSQPPP
jgi:predicted MFS family arabinose efflux permease